MNAIPTREDWMVALKEYAAATGLEKFPGNAGASEDQLAAVEEQLKIKLPASYRTFLSASNGWKFDSDMTPAIRPAEKIRWFRKEHKDWYEAYQMSAEPLSVMEKDYFDYAKQDCVVFEIKHLAQALCISEFGDEAVVLLNPMVVWPDGEWETWFFSNSSPGATRYRSFADWMCEELDQSLERTPIPDELPTVYLDPPTTPDRRVRRRQKPLVLEKVLKTLKSDDHWERCKATDQLGMLGGKQAIDALIEALNDPFPEVRWHAASSLELLHPPEALEALITAAADGIYGKANDNAIGALAAYNDEPSAQLLLKILEGGGYYAGVAGHALAKRKDARAIKPMLDSLFSKAKDPRLARSPEEIIAQGFPTWHILTQFEGAGYEALEPLVAHADVEIRGRAEKCIGDLASLAKDRITRRKAFELLQRCLTAETDPERRRYMEIQINISAKKNLSKR
jgi:HEAT repeat protein